MKLRDIEGRPPLLELKVVAEGSRLWIKSAEPVVCAEPELSTSVFQNRLDDVIVLLKRVVLLPNRTDLIRHPAFPTKKPRPSSRRHNYE